METKRIWNKKEIWSIPNIMGYFRILLIPVYMVCYLSAETEQDYYMAAIVLGVSGITDFLDGKVARHFHMITELGKFIDPLADKLTIGAVFLCFAWKNPECWILIALYIVKEGFMAVMGILFLRKGKKLDGAMWFGKLCTFVLYFIMFAMVFFPGMPVLWTRILIAICGGMMIFTMGMYIPVFRHMAKGEK